MKNLLFYVIMRKIKIESRKAFVNQMLRIKNGGFELTAEEIKKDFNRLKQKGETEGLDINDYFEIKKLRNEIYGLYFDYETETWRPKDNVNETINDMTKVLDIMYNEGLMHKYSLNDCRYIINNSLLLPLVLANNGHPEIRMYSDNSYMFLCQMHREKTPSLGVTDYNNLFYCYGCGSNGNVASYLREYENLSFGEAITLLCHIFMFDIGKKDERLKQIVKKYQDSILSEQYVELLKLGYERLQKREIDKSSKHILRNTNGYAISIEEFYAIRYQMIERIQKGEFDPNFKFEGPPKLVYLKD